MQVIGIIVGILLILAAVAMLLFPRWNPWPLQHLNTDHPIGRLVSAAFGCGMLVGGVYLTIWSWAH